MLAELGEEYKPVRKNDIDPHSFVAIKKAFRMLDKISNGRAFFIDLSTADIKTFGIYDSEKNEYKIHDGKYLYVIPYSVINGDTNEVQKIKFNPSNFADLAIGKLVELVNIYFDILDQNIGIKEKFDWGHFNTRVLK